jgi:hydrogenase expression/formation protein HypC
MATVEAFGETRQVSLLLLPEQVSLGDYLLIQAGGFAFERVDVERAEDSLRAMRELMELSTEDVRAWQ